MALLTEIDMHIVDIWILWMHGYCGYMDIVDTWILWIRGYCGIPKTDADVNVY